MNEDALSIDARLGRPRAWARDLALIGAVTALPLALWRALPPSTVLAAVVLAAAGGALIGLLAPCLLNRHVRRIPLFVIIPAAIGLGGLWGGLAGAGAALLTDAPWISVAELSASAGAAQLGWLWLPYALGLARRSPTWPTVIAACLLAPAVGWLAYVHVS